METGRPLRAAGTAAAALDAALEGLELEPADRVLVDAARSLAVKLDTLADENLLIRYHAHYQRAVGALSKRARENQAARLAAEERAEAAAARSRERQESPLRAFRKQSREEQADRARFNARQAARAARLAQSGLSEAEVAAKMKVSPVMVPLLLAHHAEVSGGVSTQWA